MLLAAHTPPLPYCKPWSASFEERLTDLCRGRVRIAYFYEAADTSTFRYRVFNMVEALNSASDPEISSSWFSLADVPRLDRFLDQADALVLCRTRYGPVVDQVLTHAKRRKIPVLFDVDDLVLDYSYVSLIIDALDQDMNSEVIWNEWFAYAGRLAATLRACDGAITTNEYLAQKISAYVPGMAARVVPNFLNRVQQEASLEIWQAKLRSKFERDDNIHLGYFSGSKTHNHDFQVAAAALGNLLDEVPNAILRIVGFLDLEGPLKRHSDRIELFPLQDFLNLQRLIGEVEINVVPLQNNVFTNCKSELKYFEAAVVGALTIASPTFTFQKAIDDGENGLLCSGYEWDSKLRAAVDIVENQDRFAGMLERAHAHSLHNYGWDGFANQIKAAVFGEASVVPSSKSRQAFQSC